MESKFLDQDIDVVFLANKCITFSEGCDICNPVSVVLK